MQLVHPTSEWVQAYIQAHPDSTVVQIAAAWYPPEVIADRVGWVRARGVIGQRILTLQHWGFVVRTDPGEHRRGQQAQYSATGVDF